MNKLKLFSLTLYVPVAVLSYTQDMVEAALVFLHNFSLNIFFAM